MEIKVVVFDDNKSLGNSLQMLIDSSQGMRCVGVFPNCNEVLKDVASSMPDVVLMDIDMPKVNGIEGLILIREHFPAIKILMQTVFEDDEKIILSLRAGADGYILKKTHPEKLIEHIREVMDGGAPMTPSVARQVLNLLNDQNKHTTSKHFKLSEREIEILNYLVKGLSYKMIADKCHITYFTVNFHIKNIFKKLKVHSVVEAVAKAINQRIV